MPRLTRVADGQSPRRLDVFVSAQSAHVSRAAARRWIDGGLITVNGLRAKPARLIRPGDVIASHVAVREAPAVEPEPMPIEVLHEDGAIIVVNKPAGLVMHPAPGHWTGTLLNGLVHHVARSRPKGRDTDGTHVEGAHGGPWHTGSPVSPAADGAAGSESERARPGLVHRLDKGTSGVLVIAKTDAAHRHLSRQFHEHSIHRVYLALVAGAIRRGGVIDQALGRDTRDSRRVSTRSTDPRRAVTRYRVAERLGPDATLVEVRPLTGRMHQIRVHLASIGHPVLGDATYGDTRRADDTRGFALGRPMLHAAVLGFDHPETGAYTEHRAPLPADMESALADWRTPVAR